jgi:BirA family biotin operon repressor/biotin-[acetyl-CoA-carboxylase] ligase
MSLPPGWALARVAATGSTNADLLAAAGRGAEEGTALLADLQTAGRGRAGRAWHSPSGNLHLSVLLRPNCPPAAAGQLGILAALAVVDLLRGLGLAPRLKWPNDVLVDGAKIAGVLVETGLDSGRVAWAVVGIGLNIVAHPEDLPYPATSLAALMPAPAPAELAPTLLAHLAARYSTWRAHGFAAARDAWRAQGPAAGDPARVRIADRTVRGRFHDLDPDGALVLEVSPGELRRIAAGDVLAT